MKELITAQKEYIALLERECGRLGSTMTVHSYLKPAIIDIDKGKELRERISKLTADLK